MSVLARLRRFWLDVHLWIGVGLLIPFAIIGVTGSLLVWHEPLERRLEPHRYEVSAGEPLPLQAHIDAARDALPAGFVVSGVRPPAEVGDPVTVQARASASPPRGQRPQTRTVFLDPATGRVLDVANTRAELVGIMHVLHGSLMIPENGRKIVGWIGWFMLVSSLTGLWLWWPRNGAVLKGLRWKRGPRTTFNLHHMAGFWLSIPLAVLALTGVYISFPQMSRGFIEMFVDAPEKGGDRGGPQRGPGAGGPPPLTETHLAADAVARAALDVAPQGARIVSINLPTPARDGGSPSWRVSVKAPEAEANLNISVDDETGEARLRGGGPAPAENIARLMRRVHDGVEMGLFWQTIIFLAGWAPFGLGVTGIVMWLRRRAARRAIQRGQSVAEGAVQAAE